MNNQSWKNVKMIFNFLYFFREILLFFKTIAAVLNEWIKIFQIDLIGTSIYCLCMLKLKLITALYKQTQTHSIIITLWFQHREIANQTFNPDYRQTALLALETFHFEAFSRCWRNVCLLRRLLRPQMEMKSFVWTFPSGKVEWKYPAFALADPSIDVAASGINNRMHCRADKLSRPDAKPNMIDSLTVAKCRRAF